MTLSSPLTLAWSQYMLGLFGRLALRRKEIDDRIPRQVEQNMVSKTATRQRERLDQAYRHIGQIGRMGCAITSCLGIDEIIVTTFRNIRELMDIDVLALGFHRPGQDHVDFRFTVADGSGIARFVLDLGDRSHPVAQCLSLQQELLIHGVSTAAGALHDASGIPARKGNAAAPSGSALYIPLRLKDDLCAVLCVHSANSGIYRRLDVATVRSLSDHVAVALDNALAYQSQQQARQQLELKNRALEESRRALEEASLTDPLTGLRNRRFLQQQMGADVAITARQHAEGPKVDGDPASPDCDLVFFLVDIDHFKKVNDLYGHAAGDMVLIQMRNRLERVFRESDYLVRWGGEEFLVVARATSRDKAEQLAERIRYTIADTPFALGGRRFLSKTCSIGFASFPLLPGQPDFMSWEQTVELADKGLYIAKHSGRDAWVGLCGTERTNIAAGADALLHDVMKPLDTGELRIARSTRSDSREALIPGEHDA